MRVSQTTPRLLLVVMFLGHYRIRPNLLGGGGPKYSPDSRNKTAYMVVRCREGVDSRLGQKWGLYYGCGLA